MDLARRIPTAVVAGGTLIVGFAVAMATTQAVGGVVLLAGVLWCVLRERRRTAWWRLGLVVLVGVACFVASHLVADRIGGWPAAVLAGVVLGAVTWSLVDRAAQGERRTVGGA